MGIQAKGNEGTGTEVLATDLIGGVHYPLTKMRLGNDGVDGGSVSSTNPMPTSVAALPLPAGAATEASVAALNAKVPTAGQKTMATSLPVVLASDQAALPVTGPMTDTQFRAVAPPTLGLTDVQMRATPVPVSGPLTDAQMRATAVPVALASLPLPAGAATEAALSALSAKFIPQSTIPDNLTSAIPVRPIGQDTWSVSFTDVGASFITPEFRNPDVGAGVGFSQAGGSLLITTGVGVNAEFLTRSVAAWRSTMLMRYSFVASQRIANQNFALLLADLVGENLNCTINSATSITVAFSGHIYTAANIGQGMFVGGISGAAGVPGRYVIASVVVGVSITFTVAGWPATGSATLDLFGHSHVKHLYNGVTPTSMLVDSQRRGWASGDTALTVNTSAAPGHVMQCELAGREVYWADMLRASSLTPNVTLRGSRVENLPDDNRDLYLFLWSFNGAAAPLSTTTWTIGFVAVERFANTPVYIQGQEMQGAKNAAPVAVVGTAAVSGTVNATVGTSISGGVISPLTVAGVSVEASSAKITSGTGATITNNSGNGASFFVNVSAVAGTSITLAVRIQVQDPVSLAWVDLPGAVTATISATGLYLLTVHPAAADVASSKCGMPLPRTYRAAWTIGGTGPSFTFSVGAQYII